jgi:hypothetical protein
VTHTQLTVVRSGLPLPAPAPGEVVVSDDELRKWALNGRILGQVQRYDVGRLVTERLSTSGRPMLLWALRWMSRRCYVVVSDGLSRDVTLALLARWTWQLARETLERDRLLTRAEREVDALSRMAPKRISAVSDLDGARAVPADGSQLRCAGGRVRRPSRAC